VSTNIKDDIKKACENISSFLLEKNKRYGNSALDPVDIFKKVIDNEKDFVVKSILIRLSDKLSRIKNSTVLRKNDATDIIGYLILLCIRKDWTTFEDLLD
tara:strand:+ start:2947 stop:3246 length:300 start_codon:yes stop_codon:yes gene_type:complete